MRSFHFEIIKLEYWMLKFAFKKQHIHTSSWIYKWIPASRISKQKTRLFNQTFCSSACRNERVQDLTVELFNYFKFIRSVKIRSFNVFNLIPVVLLFNLKNTFRLLLAVYFLTNEVYCVLTEWFNYLEHN